MPDTTSFPIVDVDIHIHEDTRALARYAEGTLRQALEWDPGTEYWLDAPDYSPLTVFDPPLSDDPAREIHVIRTPQDLRADMQSLDVHVAVLFTGRLLNTAVRPEPGYPVSVMQAYNRYLEAEWLRPEEGVYGAIMTASQDPRASAAEIERCAGIPGFAAVYLPMAGVQPLWGHRRYDPIYAAAEAAGLPVVLHGFTQVHPTFPYQLEQIDTALAKQTLAKPFGAMANFVSIVTSGTLARFPTLKVVFTGAGLAWLPTMLWRLDRQYRWLKEEVPFYDSKPSDHVHRQVYLTTHGLEDIQDPTMLRAFLTTFDLHVRTLFASDWPHYDAESPERIRDLQIPDEWKRQILSENALRIFPLSSRTAARTGRGS